MYFQFLIVAASALLTSAAALVSDTQYTLGPKTELKPVCPKIDMPSLVAKPESEHRVWQSCPGKNSHVQIPWACNSLLLFDGHILSTLILFMKTVLKSPHFDLEMLDELSWWSPIFNDDDADLVEALCTDNLGPRLEIERVDRAAYHNSLEEWASSSVTFYAKKWNEECYHDTNRWANIFAKLRSDLENAEDNNIYRHLLDDVEICQSMLFTHHACRDDGQFYAYMQERRDWHFKRIISGLDTLRNELSAKGSTGEIEALQNVVQQLRRWDDKFGSPENAQLKWNRKLRSQMCDGDHYKPIDIELGEL